MKNLGKIILHIPARKNSKRVPKKNMRWMNGKPMISYSIISSINANVTPNVYVNTDSNEIEEYVKNNFDIKIYKRDAFLADDDTSSDKFNYDIIHRLQADTLIMINPVCPLISPEAIVNALQCFKDSDCDTLISSSATKLHTFCDGIAINMDINKELSPTQSNKTINVLNWAITIWDANLFKKRMNDNGFASLGENRFLFELNHIESIKVSNEDDFIFAEKILQLND